MTPGSALLQPTLSTLWPTLLTHRPTWQSFASTSVRGCKGASSHSAASPSSPSSTYACATSALALSTISASSCPSSRYLLSKFYKSKSRSMSFFAKHSTKNFHFCQFEFIKKLSINTNRCFESLRTEITSPHPPSSPPPSAGPPAHYTHDPNPLVLSLSLTPIPIPIPTLTLTLIPNPNPVAGVEFGGGEGPDGDARLVRAWPARPHRALHLVRA